MKGIRMQREQSIASVRGTRVELPVLDFIIKISGEGTDLPYCMIRGGVRTDIVL